MKSGFVYIWKDTKRNKFYIGSHIGITTDGYVGSGRRFLNAYKARPETFRRRILEYYSECSNKFLKERETAWLSLIKISDLAVKYYNMKNVAEGGDIYSCLSDDEKRLFRLKSNNRIRKLLSEGMHIDLAEEIVKQEKIRVKLSKKKPGETWLGRKHKVESKLKQSKYRKENPSNRVGFKHTAESKNLVQLNNPNRKSIKTPYGNFYSAEDFCESNPIITPNGLRNLFKVLDLPISQRRAERCPLISLNDIGKTVRELGYSYTEDDNVHKSR